jgi:hypothetical protein
LQYKWRLHTQYHPNTREDNHDEDEDAILTAPGSDNEAKFKQVAEGTERAYKLAKQYGVKVAFGTDIQFNPKGVERQSFYLPKLTRWYAPAEILKMATSTNAELLALSGPRNPYPGKLGVVEEDALADLLLVNGDPLASLKLVEDPGKNFVVIMKDGKNLQESPVEVSKAEPSNDSGYDARERSSTSRAERTPGIALDHQPELCTKQCPSIPTLQWSGPRMGRACSP